MSICRDEESWLFSALIVKMCSCLGRASSYGSFSLLLNTLAFPANTLLPLVGCARQVEQGWRRHRLFLKSGFLLMQQLLPSQRQNNITKFTCKKGRRGARDSPFIWGKCHSYYWSTKLCLGGECKSRSFGLTIDQNLCSLIFQYTHTAYTGWGNSRFIVVCLEKYYNK